MSMKCGWYLYFFWTPSWPPPLKSMGPLLFQESMAAFFQPGPLLHRYFQYYCIFLLEVWERHDSQNITCRLRRTGDIISSPSLGTLFSILNVPHSIKMDFTWVARLLGEAHRPSNTHPVYPHYYYPNSPMYTIIWKKQRRGMRTDGKERKRDRERKNRKQRDKRKRRWIKKCCQKTNGKIKSGTQKLVWYRVWDTKRERKQKSLPFLSLIPLFSATLNKDEQGKTKVKKITKKRR